MPQPAITAAPTPRPQYRIVLDPPLPSRDGILRADDAEEQRRLKQGRARTVASHLVLRIPMELAALAIGLAIASLPFWSSLIAMDSFRSVLGWDVYLPLWVSFVINVVWALTAGVYFSACRLTWVSTILGVVFGIGIWIGTSMLLLAGRLFLVFLPITAFIGMIAVALGGGWDLLAFGTWTGLLILGPAGVALLLGPPDF